MEKFVYLQNLQKSYSMGDVRVQALKGIDLQLHKGEFTAILGASGSGKSTLLNMLGAIDNPDDGEIFIDGVDLRKMNEREKSVFRNEKLGFIFQSFNLIPVLSVYENVMLPLTINRRIPAHERHDRVMTVLSDVGLADKIKVLPAKLSGGQRQRVAIARCLVTDPILVLADEPTANLDSTTTHQILEMMLELNSKRRVTFFFSTHDEKLIAQVSRVLRIIDGRIAQ
ncbi:MAG: ABC transporter ATP-binding protein [Proteobacteria bacterium]|nr:MAG: ABC transporter ATP-binding protein [Pseudomonadota bacterium]